MVVDLESRDQLLSTCHQRQKDEDGTPLTITLTPPTLTECWSENINFPVGSSGGLVSRVVCCAMSSSSSCNCDRKWGKWQYNCFLYLSSPLSRMKETKPQRDVEIPQSDSFRETRHVRFHFISLTSLLCHESILWWPVWQKLDTYVHM